MAWEPTHYGTIVNVDFTNQQASISTEYVKIGEDFAPKVVTPEEVPMVCRFDELNALIAKDENTEEYHEAIHRYYLQYRKANHKDIMHKMVNHPSCAVSIIKDFIKRRL